MVDKFVALVRALYDWTIKWAKHPKATWALSVLSFAEASIFPLPVDPLLLAMGFSKPRKSLYYAFLTTLFSVLGAIGGYFIGAYAWSAFSPYFYQYVFSSESFQEVASHMQGEGATFVSLFIAGFSPIPFKIFTIAGGVVSAPLVPFIAACILSRGLRYHILGGIIYVMGPKAQEWIEKHFDKVTIAVSVLLVLTVIILKMAL